ncbi:sensor histidine kinase [Cohnella endophytica]|uniref:histidine kinase n=1 Tax=Cohnella endophytica TaxID=2419778 RepID=A0A494XTL4_9BACL|nr:HAMP domain-containing sensor histidine kinase [Cohnella endophytica]RKP53983.1 sensor histidine kinase [Cohnella endophytica]
MIKRVRTSKWEAAIHSGLMTLILLTVVYYGWVGLMYNPPRLETWFGWTFVIVLGQIGLTYWVGQRTQRKLEQMLLAMKQASAGNWDSRLPVVEGDAFAGVNREFNEMLGQLESRLKLLQQLGEKDVMEEATSHEAAVLEERKRLARDLHDSVSQQLFALHMSASSLPKLLERDREHAEKVMEQLIGMSSTAQRQMRGLIAQLRPMELQGKTLEEALNRWFPDYCRQNGLQGTLEIQLRGRLSEAKEHQLFLVIQEAMANVVKHAEAKTVRLMLGETDKQISLSIEDNGTGFRGEQVREGAYGLFTMRERAQKLGGEAEIVTKPGAGTRVRVWFPKFGE